MTVAAAHRRLWVLQVRWSNENWMVAAVGCWFQGYGSTRISNQELAGPGAVRREEELSRLDKFEGEAAAAKRTRQGT